MISNEKINIRDLQTFHHKDQTVTIQFAVDVSGAEVLSRLLLKLERLKDVLEVRRRTSGGMSAASAS